MPSVSAAKADNEPISSLAINKESKNSLQRPPRPLVPGGNVTVHSPPEIIAIGKLLGCRPKEYFRAIAACLTPTS